MQDWQCVGRHVVCVATTDPDVRAATADCITHPVVRHVYTIREVDVVCGQVGLRLAEIRNPQCLFSEGVTEPAFAAIMFRPVQSPDIHALRELLVDPPTPARVPERV